MQISETLSATLAKLSAWALFTIGLMLAYEVVARYFFISPTIWAEELSRLVLVWAVFVGAATLIRDDGHIRVTLLTDLLSPPGQRIMRVVTLVFLAIFAAAICWNSLPTVVDSFVRGRTTGSMMDIPSWWMQAAIPVAFGLISIQSLVQIIAVLRQAPNAVRSGGSRDGGLM